MARIEARIYRRAGVLDLLAGGVRRATGDNPEIRQTAGLSYVAEPVYQGEPIVLDMVAEGTTLGTDRRLIEWVLLFTDVSVIGVPGESERRPAAPADQPHADAAAHRDGRARHLAPERVALYLALTYDCGGAEIHDRIDPVIYQLLAGPRP